MFDIHSFSTEVRDHREAALALVGTNPLIKTYRDALRIVCDESAWTIEEDVAPVYNAHTLRAELSTAAMAAYLAGASDKQIDMIVSLCARKDDFAPMGYSHLTKAQASALINDLKAGK